MAKWMPLEIGTRYESNNSGYFTIVGNVGKTHYRVRFDDGFEITAIRHSVLTGTVKNPNYPSIFGLGFIGEGKYGSPASKGGNLLKTYRLWYHMFQRCYNPKIHEKYPSYKGVTVHEDWYNFQNFADWVENNPYRKVGWDLDKDLLQLHVENKVYGPDTCCFIPRIINGSIIKTQLELDQFHKQGIIYKVGEKYSIRNKNRGISDSFDSLEDAVNLLISHRKRDFYKLSIKYKENLDPRAIQVLEDYPMKINTDKLKKYLDINYTLSCKLMDSLNDTDNSQLLDLLAVLGLAEMYENS